MPAELLVINTGPLILLEKVNALDLAGKLPLQYICPAAVRAELDAGVAGGCPDVRPPWLTVVRLEVPLSPLARASLDDGEAEVIQLALERKINAVCLDDLRGRRIALASGLKVVGVLGLLAFARKLKLVPAIKPYTDRLVQSGAWYAPELVKRILASVGE